MTSGEADFYHWVLLIFVGVRIVIGRCDKCHVPGKGHFPNCVKTKRSCRRKAATIVVNLARRRGYELRGKVFVAMVVKWFTRSWHRTAWMITTGWSSSPGTSFKKEKTGDLWFLDDPEMLERLIDFRDGSIAKITFRLPQIHCSSCLWLLERLYHLNRGIMDSRVNFLQKRATITFNIESISLRELVALLADIGYKPDLQLDLAEGDDRQATDRTIYYQLGIAGFIFGNVMLFSFPEYLGLEDSFFYRGFGYLNLLFSLPVVLYCARDYWRSALLGIRQRHLNIDVPITLGILALFLRSTYEILSGVGAGYLDSLAGLVFFLLIGKWFQQFTYDQLNFARDYRSYFPLSVSKKEAGAWRSIPLQKVVVGDILLVRNQELIPVDGKLLLQPAAIDYSFVTGENDPVQKEKRGQGLCRWSIGGQKCRSGSSEGSGE